MPRKRYIRKRNKSSTKTIEGQRLAKIKKLTANQSCVSTVGVSTNESSATLQDSETSEDIFNKLWEQPCLQEVSYFKNNEPKKISESSSDEEFVNDEVLQDLVVEKCNVDITEGMINGRRVVDLKHILNQCIQVATHSKICTMGKYEFQREVVNGMYSKLIFFCDQCSKEIEVTSEPEETKNELNDGLVWGALSIGIGYSQIEELFSIMNVPVMGRNKFRSHERKIGKVWEETLIAKMKENAEEEKRIAIEKGNTLNGKPYISVVGDGGWAKRSYGHGLNSSSGVGVIIGAETKKILYLGVKNKFCFVCTKSKNAKVEIPKHNCTVNYLGSSTGMESRIIVEGFNRSEQDYGLYYKYYIGDGDSSVFTRIQEGCHYGRYVTKVECANHMTRALNDNLHKLSTNTTYPLESRRLLSGVPEGRTITRLERLVKGVRTAIKEAGTSRNAEDVENLRKDLKNAPNHVFGDHSKCRGTFCKKEQDPEKNVLHLLESSFLSEIHKLVDKMVRRADTLVFNTTTNSAERYMGLVSKLIGGKRVNFTSSESYSRRCHASGLSHTSGPSCTVVRGRRWQAVVQVQSSSVASKRGS